MPTAEKKKGKCAGAAKHRAAQNRYVAKDPAKQRRRVKKSEKANAAKVAARKKRARASAKRKGGSGGSKKTGRPRKC